MPSCTATVRSSADTLKHDICAVAASGIASPSRASNRGRARILAARGLTLALGYMTSGETVTYAGYRVGASHASASAQFNQRTLQAVRNTLGASLADPKLIYPLD